MGTCCDLSMYCDKEQDRKMKTNTPPPSQTHTSTHCGGLCSAVMRGLMSSLVCVFDKEGDGNHLGH